MDAIAEKLDTRLHERKPEISDEVRALVAEIIDSADTDTLHLIRSRTANRKCWICWMNNETSSAPSEIHSRSASGGVPEADDFDAFVERVQSVNNPV